jgi:hypothetical protein
MNLNPLPLLKQSIKHVPANKYAFGVVGLVAAAAISFRLMGDYVAAILGGVAIFTGAVVLRIFAETTPKTTRARSSWASRVLVWFCLGMFIVVTVLGVIRLYVALFRPSATPSATSLGTATPAINATLPGVGSTDSKEPTTFSGPSLASRSISEAGSTDSKPPNRSELKVTEIPDDLPHVEDMGTDIDRTIRQAERRLFRIFDEPSLDSSSPDSPRIDITDQFDGRLNNERTKKGSFGKAISFTLSNPGDATLFVDKLWMTVLDSGEYLLYSFPVGMRIPMKPIRYEVTLNPSESEYVLTEDKFKYGKRECDYFSVKVKSADGLWYRVRVNARWCKEGASDQKRVVATRDYIFGYPKTLDFQSLLTNAKKLDIQVNPGALSDLRTLAHLKDDSTRILVPGASYYQPTIFEQINLSRAGSNIRPTGEGVKWCVPTCSGGDFQRLRHQYIIIDDSVVLSNYQGLYGLLLRDPSEVRPFREDFEANWSYPVLFDTPDKMISELRDRKNPAQLRASAAYNLRHFAATNGITALADNVCDSSDKVSRAAKSSLEILGASEVASMRYAVAIIVAERCKAMSSTMNSSGVEWMTEYVKKLRGRH